MTSEEYARKVARLNDHLRKTGEDGKCYTTGRILASVLVLILVLVLKRY